jgi:hypothetical protein
MGVQNVIYLYVPKSEVKEEPYCTMVTRITLSYSVMVLNIRQPGYGREVIDSTVSGHFLFNL